MSSRAALGVIVIITLVIILNRKERARFSLGFARPAVVLGRVFVARLMLLHALPRRHTPALIVACITSHFTKNCNHL
jgi:hypothetical protein